MGTLEFIDAATVTVAWSPESLGPLPPGLGSSSAVGVAISVTTIPAAAFIGAAVALHDGRGPTNARTVLTANVVILVLAGTLTLLAQRGMRRTLAGGKTEWSE